MAPKHYRFLVLVLAVLLGVVAMPRAKEPPCEFSGVERIVAVGDVHGAYEPLLSILQTSGVIDRSLRWSAGKTHFVQIGDVVDRGPDSRKVLDLYRRLEREAASAGGHVHYLMGNHEAMRLTGDYRYTHPGEPKAFATSSSEALRQEYIEKTKLSNPDLSALLIGQPLGMVELLLAFASNKPYGIYLRGLNAVVRINDIVFVHGGISPATASLSCGVINETVRRELTTDLGKTRSAPGDSLAFGPDGPLWYRGLALEPDSFEPQVDQILQAQRADAIVVAHTAQLSGRFVVRWGGKVMVIDTGMQPEHVPSGRASALEIRGGVFTAIYPDGREVVRDSRAVGSATMP